MIFDFFLGRKDLLFLTEQGIFKVVQGVPAEEPEFPKKIEKTMLLHRLNRLHMS